MKTISLLLSAAPIALAIPGPAWAFAADVDSRADAAAQVTGRTRADAPTDAGKKDEREVFSTGVAKGRDSLDQAISTSSIKESRVLQLSSRSLAEVFHNLPGVRSEVISGETNAGITIRGLPLASTGAKFLQLEENGLPVLEFGDINGAGTDQFMRTDLNVAQIEAIRGGSASTFASNSPGGVINLMDKTGDVEGGSIMGTVGLDYSSYRTDFDYGAKISDTLRFHVGGFYRQGEGERRAGYDAEMGGQIKFNVTKQFSNGYIRLYGKYLNDRTPTYLPAPIMVSGTESDPKYSYLPNFNLNHDTLLSRYQTSNLTTDNDNNRIVNSTRDGQRSLVKSAGLEAQFDVAGWTITERFRYSAISGTYIGPFPVLFGSATSLATAFGGPGARLTFATGPNTGQVVNPATLGGNGLLAASVLTDVKLNNLDNVTNDIRATRVWKVGGGDLTTTAGFYKSRQVIDELVNFSSQLTSVEGDGRASLINISTATGIPLSQSGNYTYDGTFFGGTPNRRTDVRYDTNAAFGSLNYHIGRLSVGGSLRYDFANAYGRVYSTERSGVPLSRPFDINGNGVISAPERKVAYLPSAALPVDYDYNYLSYSIGANYRLAPSLAVFGRYSRGARANADRLLFSDALSTVDGSLLDRQALIDYVRQAEGGVKFRKDGVTLNATAFLANTLEHQTYHRVLNRKYRAYGVEVEAGYRVGHFNLAAGATYTKSEITFDGVDPTVVGNQPVGQPKLFGFVMPTYESKLFSIGVNVYGITDRYATDLEQLKLPGYVTVNPFVQIRPADRVSIAINVNNALDTKGISQVLTGTIPANGIVGAQAINGRTISGSLRVDF